MTRDEILSMAREAGIAPLNAVYATVLERFAALVRDYLLSTSVHSCHAGCQRFACVQTRRAVEAEREACAKVIDDFGPTLANGEMLAAAIRARGQQ